MFEREDLFNRYIEGRLTDDEEKFLFSFIGEEEKRKLEEMKYIRKSLSSFPEMDISSSVFLPVLKKIKKQLAFNYFFGVLKPVFALSLVFFLTFSFFFMPNISLSTILNKGEAEFVQEKGVMDSPDLKEAVILEGTGYKTKIDFVKKLDVVIAAPDYLLKYDFLKKVASSYGAIIQSAPYEDTLRRGEKSEIIELSYKDYERFMFFLKLHKYNVETPAPAELIECLCQPTKTSGSQTALFGKYFSSDYDTIKSIDPSLKNEVKVNVLLVAKEKP